MVTQGDGHSATEICQLSKIYGSGSLMKVFSYK